MKFRRINFKNLFLKQKKIYIIIEVFSVFLGLVIGIPQLIQMIIPEQKYEVEKIIYLARNNEAEQIQKIISKTKNDLTQQDAYWFAKAIISTIQPLTSSDDTLFNIEKITKNSNYYRYSIFLAWNQLQSGTKCEKAPNKGYLGFINSLQERGDNGPFVEITRYLESTVLKESYGIGDSRRLPFQDNTNYKLCLQMPEYYVEAYRNIREKYENETFKITTTGATSLNAGLSKNIEVDVTYLHLYKVIGALHGSAAVSFKRIGDEVNANREMAEFSKYYPEGITDAEKKAFATIYGSVYLYLLDNIFKEFNMPQTIN